MSAMSDEDDLFSSLAQQLLADLAVDDGDTGWLSLEQLEQELSQLEPRWGGAAVAAGPSTAPPASAASLVLSHTPQVDVPVPSVDAWSVSLQRFTASALEEDFLSADAARKSTQQVPQPTLDFSDAQDYNVTERPQLLPPPGLAGSSSKSSIEKQHQHPPEQQLLQEAASKLVQLEPEVLPNEQTRQLHVSVSDMAAPTPPPSAQPTPALEARKIVHPPAQMPVMAVPVATAPWQRGPPLHNNSNIMVPPSQQVVPTRVYYCHPRAPPVPAQQLASQYMSARDIAYIVHALMRAILNTPINMDTDYHVQFILRRSGMLPPPTLTPKRDILQELASRHKKAHEWSTKQHTLGHVAKTNALRPRALIAPFAAANADDGDEDVENNTDASSSNKQRASLWKARIYCDQAYQAYAALVATWKMHRAEASSSGGPPPMIHTHLQKLLKCFGMKSPTEVDIHVLALLLKLRKGRVLVARVLEQALIPPTTVQSLLPPLLNILTAQAPPDTSDSNNQDAIRTDDRLFVTLATVLATVPDLSTDTLVDMAQIVLQHANTALASPCRMQCVHALLQRGSASCQTSNSNNESSEQWNQVEAEFMAVLGGM
jgi:hypothetical protein